jgi:hypothetical protein
VAIARETAAALMNCGRAPTTVKTLRGRRADTELP